LAGWHDHKVADNYDIYNSICDISIILVNTFAIVLDGQNCINNPGMSAYEHLGGNIKKGRQVIVPSFKFNCYGRINHASAVMINASHSGDELPLFQIWRPTTFGSTLYNRIGQIKFPIGNLIEDTKFYFTNAIPEDRQTIEFQPGDVIGYYQPSNPRLLLWSINQTGFVSYSNNASDAVITYNTESADYVDNGLQPFIRVFFGMYI